MSDETRANLADFRENPDNPSIANEEQLERLAGKLKRIPEGLSAMRIAYVTDAEGGGRMVLSGNKRLRVLKRIYGDEGEVPAEWFVDITAMTTEQRREFILDANISDGDWDVDRLLEQYGREELEALMGAETVEGLLEEYDKEDGKAEGETDEDAVPETDEKPRSKPGAVYRLGDHRLMVGDSTKAEDVLTLMGGEQADLLITDPPYNVGYEGKKSDGRHAYGVPNGLKILNDKMEDAKFRAFLADAFKAADGALKPGGAIYIWYSSVEGLNFQEAAREAGWRLQYLLVWVKNRMVFGRGDYQHQCEPCLYGWKGGAAHYFIGLRNQKTVVEDPPDIDSMKFQELKEFTQDLLAGLSEISDALHEDMPLHNSEHPTMKPVRLFARQIRNSSRAGETVLDVFAGSGTTAIACQELHRRARLMELDPKYADVIRKRWAEFVHGEGCDWEALTPEVEEKAEPKEA